MILGVPIDLGAGRRGVYMQTLSSRITLHTKRIVG